MGKPGRPAAQREGKVYGLVRVLERRGSQSGHARWLVRCEGLLADGVTVCGVERELSGRALDEYPPATHIACKRQPQPRAAQP